MIRSAYHFDANWKVLLLVLLLLPLLLKLGFWQLERADEKRTLQQVFTSRSALPALSPDELPAIKAEDLAHRRVALQGHYDSARVFLLDNQILNGVVGYHLLTPLVSDSGRIFLINRGWIVGHADRRLPELPMVRTRVELEANVYIPYSQPVLLAEYSWPERWPVVVQSVDMPRIAARLGLEIYGYELRIEPGFAGAQKVNWPVINTRPEKHTGYAVQWFLMAVALVICWMYSSLHKVSG